MPKMPKCLKMKNAYPLNSCDGNATGVIALWANWYLLSEWHTYTELSPATAVPEPSHQYELINSSQMRRDKDYTDLCSVTPDVGVKDNDVWGVGWVVWTLLVSYCCACLLWYNYCTFIQGPADISGCVVDGMIARAASWVLLLLYIYPGLWRLNWDIHVT